MKKSFLPFIALFLLFGCTRQIFMPPGSFAPYGKVKIEKCAVCDSQSWVIHFPRTVDAWAFDQKIEGVELISQSDKYSIVVRVGAAFDQFAVLKKVVKSEKKK